MKANSGTGKTLKILPAVTAAALISAGISALGVSADDQTVRSAPSFELSLKEENPADSLKTQVIKDYLKKNPDIDASTVDTGRSLITVTGLDASRACIQPVTISGKLARKDSEDQSVGYDFTEKAVINVVKRTDPTIVLRGDTVTVNNGDTWNPSSYICYIADAEGDLPALQESDNVNTAQDGTYTASYKAVDSLGRSTTKNLNVIVKTPDEVIAQQQAEAAAQQQAEAEAQAQAQQEAEQAAQAQQAAQEEQVRQAQAAAQSQAGAVSDGNGTATGSNIVAIARSWIGNGIYAYGGNDPATGTDCSGFTQYVYRMAGININRVAAAQAQNGVKTDNPAPGDLVLWSGHAGIYTGNGMCVAAMNPSAGIREYSIASSHADGYFMGYYHINGVN